MSSDEHLSELSELSDAAKRAGYIVTEQIDTIIERAEREAEAIRRDAERDAEDIRREAVDAAQRLLGRLQALEFPLGNLVASLRDEMEQVSRQLEDGGQTIDSLATALPAEVGQPRVGAAGEAPSGQHQRSTFVDDPAADPHEEAHGAFAEESQLPRDDEEAPSEYVDEPPAEFPSDLSAAPPAPEPPRPSDDEGWRRWVADEHVRTAVEPAGDRREQR